VGFGVFGRKVKMERSLAGLSKNKDAELDFKLKNKENRSRLLMNR
jgi:hypothetical protein